MFLDNNFLSVGTFSLVCCVIVGYNLLRAIYNVTLHPLASVPGPVLWSAFSFPNIRSILRGELVHDMERLCKKYGKIVRIAPTHVVFADAEAWIDIFQGRPGHKSFLKSSLYWAPLPGEGTSVITAIDLETHARMRKILGPAFTERGLVAQEPILQQYASLFIRQLQDKVAGSAGGLEVDIWPWFNFFSFDLFGDLAYGESFNCLESAQYHKWISTVFNYVKGASYLVATRFYPFLEFLVKVSMPQSIKRIQSDHYHQIVSKVRRRLNWEVERQDIMSHIIKENRKQEMSEHEIIGNFSSLTVAGSETTATLLAGTTNHLIHNRDKLATLVKEVREAFSKEADFSLKRLKDLPYLNAVLNEGLRLCPPVPWIPPRTVPEGGDTVCGVWLPGGTTVSALTSIIHTDHEYFHESHSFIPERWLPEVNENPKSPFFNDRRDAVQPFIMGTRGCLGKYLAWAEIRLVLAKLLWSFDIGPVEGKAQRWEDLRSWIIIEKKEICINLKARAT